MSQHCHFDASRSLTALEQDNTIIAVIEMSQTKWLVAALVPGVERQPLKKFDAHEEGRWCFGKTPMQTFLDALPLAKEKLMAA